jgi:hypothetical protein
MKRSPRGFSIPANLSESVHRRLNMYVLTAGAAGVGMLALAQPAEAKIVYTPQHVQLLTRQDIHVDLNHDGTNDFHFYGMDTERTSSGEAFLAISPEPPRNNAIWTVQSNGHLCAVASPAGKRVGSGRMFQAGSPLLFFRSWSATRGSSRCGWAKKLGSHYVGLKFVIKGRIHYGWARVKVSSYPKYSAILTGYAFETIPNKAIITGKTKGPDETGGIVPADSATLSIPNPEPASLGLLAQGAAGLVAWRRRDAEQCA